MHSSDAQAEMRACGYCEALFTPRRLWEAFCCSKCRTAYDKDFGTQGAVASVRRINRGASVVIHLTGPAADRALRLDLKQLVRITKAT